MLPSNLIRRLIDKTDPTASLRHAAYALVVVCSCGWLSFALIKPGLDGNWVAAFGLLLAAVTTGKIIGQKDGVSAPPARGNSGDRVGITPQSNAGAKIEGKP
jgi:hypothetical protein